MCFHFLFFFFFWKGRNIPLCFFCLPVFFFHRKLVFTHFDTSFFFWSLHCFHTKKNPSQHCLCLFIFPLVLPKSTCSLFFGLSVFSRCFHLAALFKFSFFFVFCCLFVFSTKNLFTTFLFCVAKLSFSVFFHFTLKIILSVSFFCWFFFSFVCPCFVFFCVLKISFSFFFVTLLFGFLFSFFFFKKKILLFYSLALMYLKKCRFFRQIGEI